MKAHKEYAWHIMDEINFIKSNCSMLSYEAFLADEVLKRAVIRSLEIIGEAVKKNTCRSYCHLPSYGLEEYRRHA